jgi:hypothetical protein
VPLLKYLLPGGFLLFLLLLIVFALIINSFDQKRTSRFYNKLSLTENLQKYTFCRLLGCMFLQFNPLFNFIFKSNFYLTRPLRLLFFVCYLLLMSACTLIYFLYAPQEDAVRLGDIFWLGFLIQLAVLFLRPRV